MIVVLYAADVTKGNVLSRRRVHAAKNNERSKEQPAVCNHASHVRFFLNRGRQETLPQFQSLQRLEKIFVDRDQWREHTARYIPRPSEWLRTARIYSPQESQILPKCPSTGIRLCFFNGYCCATLLALGRCHSFRPPDLSLRS